MQFGIQLGSTGFLLTLAIIDAGLIRAAPWLARVDAATLTAALLAATWLARVDAATLTAALLTAALLTALIDSTVLGLVLSLGEAHLEGT